MKIKKTNDKKSQRLTAFIYGPSGVGKTTLASTLPGKTLIISAESGLMSLRGFNIDYYDITEGSDDPDHKVNRLYEVTTHLKNGAAYDNIFVDSLTEIAQIFVEKFQKEFPDRKDALIVWGEYNKKIRKFIKTYRDMTPYNVIITALEKIEKDEMSRRFRLPDMNGKVAFQAAQYFDLVANYAIIEGEKETRRMLITSPNGNILAKDRSGKLDQYEIPNLKNILTKIGG